MKFTIDKIENGTVCLIGDDGSSNTISCASLPDGIKENDILLLDEISNSYTVLSEETENKKAAMKSRLSALFKRNC